MTATAEQKMAQVFIDELSAIADAYEAGSKVEAKDRQNKKALEAMLSKVNELSEQLLAFEDVEEQDIEYVKERLADWSALIAPQADVQWNREEVTAKTNVLKGLETLGVLSDEQKEALKGITESLKPRTGGSGIRGERTPQQEIEGRPAFVAIIDADGVQFSKQKGNVPTTAGNIKTRVLSYIKTKTGEAASDEVGKAVLAAAKEVVEDGKPEATFAGFTFRALSE